MKPNYCLPIIKDQKTDILEVIDTNLDNYRYFEVWLDYITEVDEIFVNQLVETLGERLVVTFRRKNLETPVVDQARRQKLLELCANTPVLIDLDITTQQKELSHIKDSGLSVQTITSYHNYQETPDPLHLREIIATMEAYQPAVYKLSTLCAAEQDALELLQQLLELKAKGRRAIVSGMGEHGAVTRIFGTLWGNEMVFAPLRAAEQSAPGQLTRPQLEAIFKELEK